ncbi:MAG: (Fe-S)-binding protein, partial [bacterium]
MEPLDLTFYGMPGIAILWLLTVLALGAFGWRVARLTSVLRQARPENRLDHLGKRLKLFVVHVLGQRRLLEEKIGIAHFFFFWGFVVFAGTFWWALIYWLVLVLPIPYPEQIRWLNTVLDLFAAAVVVSIGVAVIRRVFFPPLHLQVTFDAYVVLGLIGTLVVTYLFGEGFSIVASPREHLAWTPAGQGLAWLLRDFDPAVARDMAVVMWWCHMTTVLGFLAYLPYSKHLHLLVAPFNVFFGNVRPKGDLGIAGEDEKSMGGAKEWKDFTWRQLLNAFACAECGRCDRACPALTSGFPLSPRKILHSLKEHFLESGLGSSRKELPEGGEADPPIGGLISDNELWSCATCHSCMERCPVWNEHIPVIVNMRRHLINRGTLPQTLQDSLSNISRYGNSFGQSDRARAKWTKELDFKIKDSRKESVDYLWV